MLDSTTERRLTALVVLLPILFLGLNMENTEAQNIEGFPYETLRSPAMGLRGVVATSQPLAANAGLDILKKGGNAIDAAVATAAVLTLVEPNSTSLGGDAFIMIYIAAEDKLVGINASGRAPYSMTLDALNVKLDKHGMDRISGIYSVSVPGAVDGWFEVLEEYGTMTMAEVLEPAIHYAENGFPVSPIIAGAWRGLERNQEPSTRAALLLDGERAPRAGDVFRNPDLAHTFRLLAEHGRDAFYKGPIAEAIVAYSDQHDGFLTMKDFEDHTSTWVEPIFADYGDYRLYELPPNGQGIAALEMIKILGNVDLGAMGHNSAEYLHHIIEAKKLAYADIQKWNGDPEFNHLPIQEIISTEYGRQQFERIDPKRAMQRPESGISGNGDTILLEVMDKDHNAVSFIYSIYSGFGSGLVVSGNRLPAAEQGRTLLAGARPHQRRRAAQAPVPHDHPRDGVQGRRVLHDVRGHGRRRSAAAARADLPQRRRIRNERAASRRDPSDQSRERARA